MTQPVPRPSGPAGLRALRALLRERTPLAAMQVVHRELGDVFQLPLPGFHPVVLVGPEAARFVLVEARDDLRWRNEPDPVTRLLRHGILVEDGDSHDDLRRLMSPSLHKQLLVDYVGTMWRAARQITQPWGALAGVDMLVEMRRITLLILMETLFRVDFAPDMQRLWDPILTSIGYISPGLWVLWPGIPRPQYQTAINRIDAYFLALIRARRAAMPTQDETPRDMLSLLIDAGLDDHLIRDQLLTMLIAGPTPAPPCWPGRLYLLGSHPEALARARSEVAQALPDPSRLDAPGMDALNNLPYLGQVIKEALRLYPPIHMGSRVAAIDLEFKGYHIPAGERVVYSIYLTQRRPAHWPEPERCDPERHAPGQHPEAYAWLAFGGGPRNCIGAAFGQLEVKVVLAYLLSHFDLTLTYPHIHQHMGATLEPRPGVRMLARRL
jgi:cytochrome P450